MAGYSGTPLAAKLGITAGTRVAFVAAPRGYRRTLGRLPAGVTVTSGARSRLDVIQFFTTSARQLGRRFSGLGRALAPRGALWISWPKGSSGVATDLNENVVREIGLAAGWVDVKVCAVDEVWSGLKFVRRVKDQPGAGR